MSEKQSPSINQSQSSGPAQQFADDLNMIKSKVTSFFSGLLHAKGRSI